MEQEHKTLADKFQSVLTILSVIGFSLFALLMASTFLDRQHIETSAKTFVQNTVKKDMLEKRSEFADTSFGAMLETLAQDNQSSVTRVQKALDNNLDKAITEAIARFCDLDCDKNEGLRQSIRQSMDDKLERLNISTNTIEDFVHGKYEVTISALRRDLRIFSGTNMALFALLFLAMLIRKKARVHLMLPATLLLSATIISTLLYIFGQNWFYTILYNNYWGFAYSAYAGIIFLILLDIFLNGARVTTEIINVFLQTIGSALSVVSC